MTDPNRSFVLRSMLSALEVFATELGAIQMKVTGERSTSHLIVDWHNSAMRVLFGILILGDASQKGLLPKRSGTKTALMFQNLKRPYR